MDSVLNIKPLERLGSEEFVEVDASMLGYKNRLECSDPNNTSEESKDEITFYVHGLRKFYPTQLLFDDELSFNLLQILFLYTNRHYSLRIHIIISYNLT